MKEKSFFVSAVCSDFRMMWWFESVHGFGSVGNLYQKMHFARPYPATERKRISLKEARLCVLFLCVRVDLSFGYDGGLKYMRACGLFMPYLQTNLCTLSFSAHSDTL